MNKTTRRSLTVVAALALGGFGFWFTSGTGPQAAEADTNEIRWVLTGINPDEGGTIRCALYRDEASWLDQSQRFRRATARVRGNSSVCVFRGMPPGTYAMAALHDADNDREMDKSLIGIPQEGYAISRDEHDRMSAPDFEDAAIQFDGGRMTSRARMKY